MKLIKITSQHRRDFMGIYECEHCGEQEETGGYDDANFHNNVTPNWKCPKCGKTSPSVAPVETKYPEGFQV